MKTLLLVLCLAVVAFAISSRVTVEPRRKLDDGWRDTRHSVVMDHPVSLIIAVKNRNTDKLTETLMAVSDPKSPEYGNHLSLSEIIELTGPTDEMVKPVEEWLKAHKFSYGMNQGRDFIFVESTIEHVETVFGVKYTVHEHSSGFRAPATMGPYFVPPAVRDSIDFISGITGVPTVEKPKPRMGVFSLARDESIYPRKIRERYNVTEYLVGTAQNNLQAVAEFQGQYYSESDLTTFYQDFVKWVEPEKITQIVGQNHDNQPGVEAMLDVEYIMGCAPGVETWFYSLADFDFWHDLVVWLSTLGNETTIPNVMSVSYGSQGDYPSDSYMQRAEQEYQKLGTRGLSMIYASGDSGAGCGGYYERGECQLDPSYPAISAYVTSVGATRFLSGDSGPEGAVELFLSGGGFALEAIPMPDYQKDLVNAYLTSGVTLPKSSAFNASGRATPDVAALGDEHFMVVCDGELMPIGGTSASAPTFAALVSLLNDQRLNAGKPTLGFLNPWIYQTAASTPNAFWDVTVGDNIADYCNGCGQGGFKCAAGWDPVTGVGTPNFEVLASLV